MQSDHPNSYTYTAATELEGGKWKEEKHESGLGKGKCIEKISS